MFCIFNFLFQFGENLVRIKRTDPGGVPGRFDVALGVSFVLGWFVEESLVDTSAGGTGVCSDCRTISRLQWGE